MLVWIVRNRSSLSFDSAVRPVDASNECVDVFPTLAANTLTACWLNDELHVLDYGSIDVSDDSTFVYAFPSTDAYALFVDVYVAVYLQTFVIHDW